MFRKLVVISCLVVLAGSVAVGQEFTLDDLYRARWGHANEPLHVMVESVGFEEWEPKLKTVVELYLRTHNIPVADTHGNATLEVRVIAVTLDNDRGVVIALEVSADARERCEHGSLVRRELGNSGITLLNLGTSDAYSYLKQRLQDDLDSLLNDLLKYNPDYIKDATAWAEANTAN